MNEGQRIKAFGFVAACCGIGAVCFFVAAALGNQTTLYMTLAFANVGCASVFGLVAVGKAKQIRNLPKQEGLASPNKTNA